MLGGDEVSCVVLQRLLENIVSSLLLVMMKSENESEERT